MKQDAGELIMSRRSHFSEVWLVLVLILGLGCVTTGFGSIQGVGGTRDEDVKFTPVAGPIDKDGRQVIRIKMEVSKGWHAHANPVQNPDYEPNKTDVKVSGSKKLDQVSIVYPPGKRYSQGKDVIQVYEGTVEIVATIIRAAGDLGPLALTIDYTVCDDNVCKLRQTAKFDIK